MPKIIAAQRKKININLNVFICEDEKFKPAHVQTPKDSHIYLAKTNNNDIKKKKGERLHLIYFPLEGN